MTISSLTLLPFLLPSSPPLPPALVQLDFLDHHHDHEDEIEFPFIQSKVDTAMFTADHEELESILESLHSTVQVSHVGRSMTRTWHA